MLSCTSAFGTVCGGLYGSIELCSRPVRIQSSLLEFCEAHRPGSGESVTIAYGSAFLQQLVQGPSFPDPQGKGLVSHKLPVLVHISNRFRGQPISTRWFVSRIRSRYLSIFNSPIPAGFSAYSLRRGGATAYYNAGLKDIHLQHLLRHKSLETTQVYINSSDQQSVRRFISTHLLDVVSPS